MSEIYKGRVELNLRGVHGQGDDSGDDRDEGSGGSEVLHVGWVALNGGGVKIRWMWEQKREVGE